MKPVVAIGSGIGGLAVGLFVGIVLTALIVKKQHKKGDGPVYLAASPPVSPHFSSFNPPTTPGRTSNYTPVPSSPFGVLHNSMGSSNQSSFGQPVSQLGRSPSYAATETFTTGEHGGLILEPASFLRLLSNGSAYAGGPASQLGRSSYAATETFTTGEHGRLNPEPASFLRPLSNGSAYAGGPAVQQNQVYVPHNNSQAPPVAIYRHDGAQIVEPPPRYAAGAPTSRREGAHDALSDVHSFSDGSDGGRTATTDTATLLQEHRSPSMIKKPANGMYSGGPKH